VEEPLILLPVELVVQVAAVQGGRGLLQQRVQMVLLTQVVVVAAAAIKIPLQVELLAVMADQEL
jgi:hypothetical protein